MRTTRLAVIIAAALFFACSAPSASESSEESSLARSDERSRSVLIAGGYDHTCVLARRVRCWGGDAFGQSRPPALRHPIQIGAGDGYSCALDDEGVKCWGLGNAGQTNVPATLRRPWQIAVGYSHACALDEEGVKCWGRSDSGQTNVPALRRPRQVVAGANHTCALDDDGVKCWGSNADAQTAVPALVNPTQLVAGALHSCAITGQGVKCWGHNGSNQTAVPANLRNPTQLAAGRPHTCAITDDGVKCWGTANSTVPAMRGVTQIGAGHGHTCAVDETGIKCWGVNPNGQATVPADVDFAARHACVASATGARCIGDNESGQLGAGDEVDRYQALSAATPVALGGAFGAPTQVAIGRAFGCARNETGAVKCWGSNANGRLGLGDTRDRGTNPGDMGDALPALRFGGSPVTKLDLGESHACAVTGSGELYCWGDGRNGRLGTEAIDDVGQSTGPTRPRLSAGVQVRDVALGRSHTCVATTAGAVYCFGSGDRGQLGTGSRITVGDRPGTMGDALRPVDLGDGFVAKSVGVGDQHSCAVSMTGVVKCWGANSSGELGLGDARDRGTSPGELGNALAAIDLGPKQVAVEVACGARHCCARLAQNTLRCWGDNADGQLGLGDVLPRGKDAGTMGEDLPFVPLPAREAVLGMQLDGDRTCVRTGSGLRCWGRNRSGELGYGDREPRGTTQATLPKVLSPLGI